MYLYCFSDGSTGASKATPTAIDMAMLRRGELRVFVIAKNTIMEMNTNGNWMQAQEAIIQDGCEGQGEYHFVGD